MRKWDEAHAAASWNTGIPALVPVGPDLCGLRLKNEQKIEVLGPALVRVSASAYGTFEQPADMFDLGSTVLKQVNKNDPFFRPSLDSTHLITPHDAVPISFHCFPLLSQPYRLLL